MKLIEELFDQKVTWVSARTLFEAKRRFYSTTLVHDYLGRWGQYRYPNVIKGTIVKTLPQAILRGALS